MFNRKENQEYKGQWPDASYYQPEFMSVKDSRKFMAWYEDQKYKVFDFQAEILHYCRKDVSLLR